MNRLRTSTLALILLLVGTLAPTAVPVAAQERPADQLPVIAAAPATAQQSTLTAEIKAAAVELSRLEAERDFNGLYQRLHPDSRRLVPFAAFEGWYEALLAGKTTDELTVTDSNFIDWTWGVTGVTYDDTAQVHFVQP